MRLSSAEKWARRAGAAGGVLMLAVIYLGLRQATQRNKGRSVGHPLSDLPASFWLYVVMGLGVIFPLVSIWRPLSPTLPARTRLISLVTGVPLYFGGLALMLWGRFTLGEMYNVSSSLGVQLFAGHKLIASGPYAFVRHPMYLGGQLAALGSLLIYRTWATLIIALSLPAFMFRARREEEALAAEFGSEWIEYKRRVPFWLPRIFFKLPA